jgi:hypothetical protein
LKTPPFTRLLLAVAAMAVLSRSANAQLVADSVTPSSPAVSVSQAALLPQVAHARPTQKMKLRGYLFDAFGPYPIVGAALAAGINQGEEHAAGMEARRRSLPQAIRLQLWHRRDNHNHTLCAGGSFPRGYPVLPLPMQRRSSSSEPCDNFDV